MNTKGEYKGEVLSSRQNALVKHFVALGADADKRRAAGEYLCAGEKLLKEAMAAGAEITMVLWTEPVEGLSCRVVSKEILDYVSPLKNSDGPVFTVRLPAPTAPGGQNAIVLENLQDPGNLGTVLRTADALGIEQVVLCGACADPWGPKAVRATMGAIFRQKVVRTPLEGLRELLGDLPLYGAALSDTARDIRSLENKRAAIAIGNEGKGLSAELLAMCDGHIIIPMEPCAESLNAGVAAAICMWELRR